MVKYLLKYFPQVLWGGLGGTETGNAITDVLYGDWNPSGHLPYTIAKNALDYPTTIYEGDETLANNIELNVTYSEGLLIDYRWFDAVSRVLIDYGPRVTLHASESDPFILQKNITPRFEFGFGLSYTTFEYSNLNIAVIPQSNGTDEANWDAGNATKIEEGSSTALW